MPEANSALPKSDTINQYPRVASELAHKPKLWTAPGKLMERGRWCYQDLITPIQPECINQFNTWKRMEIRVRISKQGSGIYKFKTALLKVKGRPA